jgi:hypothetical protein
MAARSRSEETAALSSIGGSMDTAATLRKPQPVAVRRAISVEQRFYLFEDGPQKYAASV